MKIKKVLVIGGTGLLGHPVAVKLAEEGFDVYVGTRRADASENVPRGGLRFRRIDISDPADVRSALEGFDAVHLSLPSGPRYEDCFNVEFKGAQNVASAAKEAGIKRISYLSGMSVSPRQTFPPARAKWLAEEAVRNSGIDFTIWRPTWFMESLSKLIRFKFIFMLGKGETSVHWVYAGDFGVWVAKSFESKKAANRVFYVFGPESMSMKRAIQILQESLPARKLILRMPVDLGINIGRFIPDKQMWFGAQMMKFLEKEPEKDHPDEASALFGAMSTTVADYCRNELAPKS